MTLEEARALISKLTAEEKQALNAFITKLISDRKEPDTDK